MKDAMQPREIVQYLPILESERNAPRSGVRFVDPDHTLITYEAVTFGIWNLLVK